MTSPNKPSSPAKFKTVKPWPLLISSAIVLVLGVSLLFWVVTVSALFEKLHIVQFLTFTILSSLIIFQRTKGAWTISIMGWVTSFVLLTISWPHLVNAYSGDMIVPILSAALVAVNFGLTLFYFKHPYIDARTGVLGTNYRQNIELELELIADGRRCKAQSVSVSPSGFKIARPADFAPTIGDALRLRIGDASSFESRAVVVDVNESYFAVELRGWTLRSMGQHVKWRRWLRRRTKGLR